MLREAVKRFPPIVYAWGVVGIAAAAGLIVAMIGADLHAIRIWLLVFGATVLIAIFAQGVSAKSRRQLPGQALIWAILAAFLIFLAASISAVMGLGPAAVERFWSIDSKPEARTVPFQSATSSPVNFGCERGASIPLNYRAPPGYLILNAQAETVAVVGAKSASANGKISADRLDFSGQADFFGKDREFYNCPGGGHGQAKVVGELVRESELAGFPAIPVFISIIAGLAISTAIIVLRLRRSVANTSS